MKDLMDKVSNDFNNSKVPFINLLQAKHPKVDVENDLYNEDAKQGMFWISNLEDDLFFEEIDFIFLDYQKMLSIIIKEKSLKWEEERKIIRDNGQSRWNDEIKKFCIYDDTGEMKRANSFVYMSVLIKLEDSFIAAMIKVSPGSMKNFNDFVLKMQEQRGKEEKELGKGNATATHYKLFKLNKIYIKNTKNPYYAFSFDENYTKIDSSHEKLIEDKFNEIFTKNNQKQYLESPEF